jgi:hypothetical protein
MSDRASYDPPDYESRGPLNDSKCKDEVSEFFHDGMRSRMAVSFYKYGPVADGYPGKVDALKSLEQRIDKYLETGNAEFLMDAANFCMIEFMHPSNPQAFFQGTDSDQSPGRIEKCSGEAVQFSNRDIFE